MEQSLLINGCFFSNLWIFRISVSGKPYLCTLACLWIRKTVNMVLILATIVSKPLHKGKPFRCQLSWWTTHTDLRMILSRTVLLVPSSAIIGRPHGNEGAKVLNYGHRILQLWWSCHLMFVFSFHMWHVPCLELIIFVWGNKMWVDI